MAAASHNDQDWPAEEDLSLILKRLMGDNPRKHKARRRLANDKLTREYLEAGIRLMVAQFEPRERSSDADEDSREDRPFFDWLPRALITEEVSRGELGMKGGDGSFRHRWEEKADYIEDLLSYALWSRHWSLHVSNAQESIDLLTSSSDFVRAIHLVAYNDLSVLLKNPAYRLSMIAAAVADRDATVREAVSESYRVVGESWQRLYEETLAARGLKLRPGVTFKDLTNILTALAEGIGMRMLADPDAKAIDHDKKESLLGKAALAVAAACIDSGDGKSLEELVSLLGQTSQVAR